MSYLLGMLSGKNCCSFGLCPNEGGEGPAQVFWHIFTNCILGQAGEGGEETSARIFWQFCEIFGV